MNNASTERLLAEGKTKKILIAETPGHVVVESKDDLTAGDGAKHDVISGKAPLSNRTTSNVFRILKACGLPVAFVEEVDETRFLAEQCDMIPYEVVVRREAYGSFLKRHPGLQILAMRNPRLYAELRFRQEKRICNIIRL